MNIPTAPIEVSGPDAVARIGRFRFQVWSDAGLVVPEAFPGGSLVDALDPVAHQFIVEIDGLLVAAVRYTRFERMDDMPAARDYRAAGLHLEGPCGLPQRMVVAPSHQHLGLARLCADHVLAFAKADGVRWLVMEVAPPLVPFLVKRGRRHVGPAARDPRFPEVDFQLIVTDMSTV